MPKYFWDILFGFLVLAGIGVAGLYGWRRSNEAAALRAEAGDLRAQVSALSTNNLALAAELAVRDERVDKLEDERKQVQERSSSLQTEMRSLLESRDVRISELEGKLTVDILDRVLFDTGKAEIKPAGAEVLLKIAGVLNAKTNREVQVIGHTDNVPIRATKFSRYQDNWDLSAARALAAVRFLVDEGQVNPAQLGALAYGEHRPIADNATEDGRARNRRIAVVFLPEVLKLSDEPPRSPAPVLTNAPTAFSTNDVPTETLAPVPMPPITAPKVGDNPGASSVAPTNAPPTIVTNPPPPGLIPADSTRSTETNSATVRLPRPVPAPRDQ